MLQRMLCNFSDILKASEAGRVGRRRTDEIADFVPDDANCRRFSAIMHL
jgi:hypothetical protein